MVFNKSGTTGTPSPTRRSMGCFLADHLSAAMVTVQELEAHAVKDSVKVLARKVMVSIQVLQHRMKENANSEHIRKAFEDAWSQIARLKEEIERQGTKYEVLNKLSGVQFYLQDFQTKFVDYLTLDHALQSLRDFDAHLRSVYEETITRGAVVLTQRERLDRGLTVLDAKVKAAMTLLQTMKEQLKTESVERMGPKFQAALQHVQELCNDVTQLNLLEVTTCATTTAFLFRVRESLFERASAAKGFLNGFQERVFTLAPLDQAVLALQDIADVVHAAAVEGKECCLMGLEFSRQRILSLKEGLHQNFLDQDGECIYNLKKYYFESLEAVRQIQYTHALTNLTEQKRELLCQKVKFVYDTIEQTVTVNKHQLQGFCCRVKLSEAMTLLYRVRTQIFGSLQDFGATGSTKVNAVREKFRSVLQLLEQLMVETAKSGVLLQKNSKEVYKQAFAAISNLQKELLASSLSEPLVEQFNEAYNALTVAAVQDKALSTCVNVTVNAATFAQQKFPSVVEMGKSFVQRARALDDRRFGSGVQTQFSNAITRVQDLDQRYLNGKAASTVYRAVAQYGEQEQQATAPMWQVEQQVGVAPIMGS
ncbi:unnamed protein product [Amoebophrya sp. A120]|nr:unnamed protein product [Amoebophrya sp. A120]|eukprot:GSA120T00018898001.1